MTKNLVHKKSKSNFGLLIFIALIAILSCAVTILVYNRGLVYPAVQYIEIINKKETSSLVDVDIVFSNERIKKIVNWNSISAKSVYAFNPQTGKVYYQRNINEKLPIASITKLMTAYTVISERALNESVTVDKKLPSMDLPIGLTVGDEITVEELLQCSLISSKNDCANQLANTDPTFISKMNEYANGLGMNNSRFSNPTGFVNTNNYSTAYDLGLLASAISRNSEVVKITDSVTEFVEINGNNQRNIPISTTNVMLKENPKIKGLKTGFTYASGECLVLFYDYGGSEELITIVLDSKDRFGDSRKLYNLIIQAFN